MATARALAALLACQLTAGAASAAALPHRAEAPLPRGAVVARAGDTLDPGGPCVADCDGSGAVSVDELFRGVAIAIGVAAIDDCAAVDCHGTGRVTIHASAIAAGIARDDAVELVAVALPCLHRLLATLRAPRDAREVAPVVWPGRSAYPGPCGRRSR
jgi:hypothetical protein